MKNLVTLIAILFLSLPELKSQLPSMPSPTASNLGLYGEIPVSEYTGTPDISIPLYEFKSKSFTVPVALSYHASGIRPELHPGPTGLGWTLLAGGAITREVRGLPDENDCKGAMGTVGYGYLCNKNGWLAQSAWRPSPNLTLEEYVNRCTDAFEDNYEFEADEFSFNFFGISGKFYFDQTGSIRVQSDRPLTVSFDPNNYLEMWELDFDDGGSLHRSIREFVITDERGNRYCFGGKDAVEISEPVSYGHEGIPTKDMMSVTSWFITRAESADGQDVISFAYERGPFISQLYKWSDNHLYLGTDDSGNSFQDWSSMSSYNQNGSFISPVYLRTVTSTNGTVISLSYSESAELEYPDKEYHSIFERNGGLHPTYDPYPWLSRISQIPRLTSVVPPVPMGYSNPLDNIRWLKCDAINIRQEFGSQIKTVVFHYNNNASERLFLDSLTIKGEPQGKEPPYGPPPVSYGYSFTYKNRHLLRPYLENMTDHWGFDNGQGYGSSFTPSLRNPNAAYAHNGILSSIRYPTGGVTTFEYDSHGYSKAVDNKNRTLVLPVQGVGSGARIRKITSDDGQGGGFSKEYFYRTSLTANVSSGILNATPVYAYSIDVTMSSTSRIQHFYLQNTPVVPLTQWNDGIPIAYTDVYVKQSGEGVNNGYIHYTFTNHDNGHTDNLLAGGQYHRAPFPKDPHNSRAFERGKLKKEVHYNAVGRPVYEKETTWERYGSQGEDNPRSLLFGAIPAPSTMPTLGYTSIACYLNYVYKFLPATQVETVFDADGFNPVSKTTIYTYNAQMLLSAEETTNSRGIRKATYKYPSDFASIEPYRTMVAKHILSPVVEKIQYQDDVFLQKDLTRYRKWTPTLFAPELSQTQTGLQAVPDTYLRYLSYDTYGNPVAVSIDGTENVVYLWSYGGQYLVAEIRNATLTEVNAVLGSVFGVASANALSTLVTPDETALRNGSLQRALPNSQVTTCTYKPLVGVISSTDPAGLTTTCEYDPLGRLARIKDADGRVIESYEYNYAR